MTNEHTIIMYILALSITIQMIAAILAFRLIPITGRQSAWRLIALALTLMAVRRVLPLYRLIIGDTAVPPDLINEVIGLVLSSIMAVGIASIAPLFMERKQAEEALWKSSQMLKLVLDNMPAFVFWKDRASVYVGCNNLFARNAGFDSPEKIIGLTDLDLPWKDTEAESYRADDRMVMETGVPKVNYEETQLTAEGNIMVVRTSKIPLRDSQGIIIGVLGAFEDITERKRAEEALRESEEKYRLLHENAGVGIGYYQTDGKIISYNQLAASHMGGKPEDFIGKSIYDIFPKQEADFYMKRIKDSLASEGTIEYEDHVSLPLGEKWFLSVFAKICDSHQSVIGVQIISQDITERKQADEALAHERALLRAVIDLSPDAIFVKDLECRKTLTNPADLERMGVHSEMEALGKTDFEMYSQDVAAKFYANDQEVLQTGQPLLNREVMIVTRDGQLHWLLTSKVPLRNSAGQVVGLVGVGRDITERKQAEDALRESERRYHEIFDNVLDGLYLLKVTEDGRFCIMEVNPAVEQITGIPHSTFIGKTVDEFLPDETAMIINNILRHCVEAGHPTEEEAELNVPAGRRCIQSTLIPGYGENGNIDRIIGISRDITARKRAENALRASEERYRLVFENSPISLWEEDFSQVKAYFDELRAAGITDFRAYFENHSKAVAHCAELIQVLDVNQATLTLLDIKDKRTLLAGLPQVLADSELKVLREEMIAMAEGSQRFESSEEIHRTLRGDQKFVTVHTSVAPGYEHSLGKVLVSLVDITERKRAEEEVARSLVAEKKAREVAEILREANESLSRTLNLDEVLQNLLQYLSRLVPYDSANVMLSEGDFQYRVVAMRGYERWTDINFTQKIAFDSQTAPVVNEVVANQKSLIIDDSREYPGWARLAGTEHVISWLGVPIVAGGQVIGLYSVDKVEPGFFTEEHRRLAEGLAGQAAVAIQNARLHDQIKRVNVELEQRVLERTAQLEAANRELEAFAYSVSHDLRAPLRHIDGFIEMLRLKIKASLDEQSKHYMENISTAANRMGVLIEDLLAFSRMGSQEMSKTELDLNILVKETIEDLKPEVENRKVEWKISPLPNIIGDRAMLRIVLVNLILNALKFTRPRAVAQIEIGYERREQAEIVIFIRDNGVGFDMAYADKLFGVFQRLHLTDEFEGTGIGLANVRRIINRHGGRTWAESEVDKGATFYFSLPRFAQEA